MLHGSTTLEELHFEAWHATGDTPISGLLAPNSTTSVHAVASPKFSLSRKVDFWCGRCFRKCVVCSYHDYDDVSLPIKLFLGYPPYRDQPGSLTFGGQPTSPPGRVHPHECLECHLNSEPPTSPNLLMISDQLHSNFPTRGCQLRRFSESPRLPIRVMEDSALLIELKFMNLQRSPSCHLGC